MKDYLLLGQTQTSGGQESTGQTQTQSATKSPSQEEPALPPKKPSGFEMMLPFLAMILILLFFTSRSSRKKQKQHQQLLESLNKNQRIQTIGGIIGTVVDVRDKEVVIKIDESNNTKIRIARSAIHSVLGEEEK